MTSPRFLRHALGWLFCCLIALPTVAAEKVVLQLKWQHQFQFAGYYAAIAQGYYQQLGLQVELREARPGIDPTSEVLAGHAQYGVATSDLVLLQARGEPVVVLAPIFQHSAQVILARRDRGLNTVHDLVGHKVAIEAQSAELFALLSKEGVKAKDLQLSQHNFDPGDLVGGRIDAISAYSTDEPFPLRLAGIESMIFSPRSGGIDFYGDSLFTTQKELKEHPERVRAFLAATLKGWQYAMAHQEEIVDLILNEYSPRHSREHLLFEAQETARLIQSPLVEIGHNNPGRWRHMAETYNELGLLPDSRIRDGFLYDRNPQTDHRQLITALIMATLVALALAGAVIAFSRLNRRLKEEVEERAVVERKLRWRSAAIEAAGDGVVITDTEGRVLYVNPAFCHMTGYAESEVINQLPSLLKSGVHDRAHYEHLWSTIRSGQVWRGEMVNRRQDGSLYDESMTIAPVFDANGQIERFVAIKRDATQSKATERALAMANENLQARLTEISELHALLEEQVVRDPLSQLYNRRYLDETLPREVARARRDGYPLTLAIIDIDHFKQVNDTYGHPAGDEVIRALSELLRANARDGDIACRYGGEEFVLVLPHLQGEHARARAEAWRTGFAERVVSAGSAAIQCTISIGLATYPQHAGDADTLLQGADLALYLAKHAGRNRVVVFDPVAQAEI